MSSRRLRHGFIRKSHPFIPIATAVVILLLAAPKAGPGFYLWLYAPYLLFVILVFNAQISPVWVTIEVVFLLASYLMLAVTVLLAMELTVPTSSTAPLVLLFVPLLLFLVPVSLLVVLLVTQISLMRREEKDRRLGVRDCPRCPNCTYPLIGLKSDRCPECGTPFRWQSGDDRAERPTTLDHAEDDARK